ncbi:MAG: MBG domain-containing protein, partial [Clostridia bacterium]|nr:MBG domain-containing protein [Clostridia bacterium]
IYVIGQNLIVNEDDGYEIRLRDNGNADGYIIDISNVSARLFVMRKQLHIMADSVSKRYGEGDPILGYSILENDEISLTGDIRRVAGEEAGRYLIEQHSLINDNNPNYDIIYVPNYFTVFPKALRVSIPVYTKIFGQADAAYPDAGGNRVADGINFVVNEEDLRFNDKVTVLKGNITRDAGEAAGQYAFRYSNVDAGKNYTVIFTEVRYLHIQRATPEFSADAPPVAGAITYGDTLSSSVINGQADIPGQFYWDDSGIMPSVHNSNVTEYAATFIPSDGANYNSVGIRLKLTVSPRRISIAFVGSNMYVYDGHNKAYIQAVAYNVLPQDEVNVTVSYSSEYLINAGEYTVYAAINDINYEAIGSATATITIARSQLDVTVKDAVIFEGDDYTPEFLYTGFKGQDGLSSLSVVPRVRNVPEDPGAYEIAATGGSAVNYLLRYIPGKLTIHRRSIETDDIKLEGEMPHDATVSLKELGTDSGAFVMMKDFVAAALASTPNKGSVLNSFSSLSVNGEFEGEYTYTLKLSLSEGSPVVVQHRDGSIELLTDYTVEDGYVTFTSSNVSGVGALREATFFEEYSMYMFYGGIGLAAALITLLSVVIANKLKKRKRRLTPRFKD